MKHLGDEEGDVRNDDNDHWFHRAHVRRESGGEAAGQTEQDADTDRYNDDDEE